MSEFRFSYWEKTSLLARAEVIIVGAGLMGLQTALALKKQRPGMNILLVERGPFSRGASTRNAGFACFGSPTELLSDLAGTDPDRVWETVARRYAGILRLAEQHGPDVRYRNHGGFEIFPDPAEYAAVRDRLPELNGELKRITGVSDVWHPVKGTGGIRAGIPLLRNVLEGQLHPGLLVARLEKLVHAAGVRILNGVEIKTVEPDSGGMRLRFAEGEYLEADRVVLTTNAFTPRLWPEAKIQPARNQVFLTAPIPGLKLRGCFHRDRGYVYFRNVGPDRILIGGGRQMVGPEENTSEFGKHSELEGLLLGVLHGCIASPRQPLSFERSWSGIIAQGGDKSPILERIDDRTVVAARLAGMGVALSAQLAEEAADLLLL